jgi:hypothetical protein
VHFKGTGKKILFAIDFRPVRYRLKTAAQGGGLFMNVPKRSKTTGKKNFFTCPFKEKKKVEFRLDL